MQLFMAESHWAVWELYLTAYSLPRTMVVIRQMITQKLESASGGIMRSFMARPCDMYFTRKVRRFPETTFRVFQTPDEKIQEAIAFVQQFAFADIARMMQYLRDDGAA